MSVEICREELDSLIKKGLGLGEWVVVGGEERIGGCKPSHTLLESLTKICCCWVSEMASQSWMRDDGGR